MRPADRLNHSVPDRVPYLDGLRGIAVLMVVALHYLHGPFHAAGHPNSWYLPLHHLLGASWAGVDLFFVLSGFLLGGILLDNRASPNLFAVFYLRRACRILPPYLLLLLPLVLIPALGLDRRIPALGSFISTGEIPAWTYPLFLQNLVMSLKGSWGEAWISTTWSLAVEEQFYLMLPLLIRFVPVRRLPVVFLTLVVLAPVFRLLLHAGVARPQAELGSYTLLPCRWDSLLLGATVAWLVRDLDAADWLGRHTAELRRALLLLAGGVFVLVLYSPQIVSIPMRTGGYSLFALLFATVILCGHHGVLPGRNLLELPWLRGVGRISYTLYLVHYPLCSLVFHLIAKHPRVLNGTRDLLLMAGSFVLSLAIASLSWKLVEQPILRLGRRSPYQPAAVAQGGENRM